MNEIHLTFIVTSILLVFILGILFLIIYKVKKLKILFEQLFANNNVQNQVIQQEVFNLQNLINTTNIQLTQTLKHQLDYVVNNLHNHNQLIENKLNHLGVNFDDKMFRMQNDNSDKLEKIRQTVDEKLHETLESRLSETFKVVSERLEQVHRGIGEMQSLATGVGDLKRILSNVKTRGIWGEVQLEAILEQMMSMHQYEKNVCVRKNSQERVEFAVKLPSQEQDGYNILLPIDAKFPLDVYQKLAAAQDIVDINAIDIFTKELENAIKKQAKMICDKYINTPHTTEFAIMFLPTEGLYAEVIRIPGLSEYVQLNYRVVLTGPTTLAAILSSLQMGYRTIAIQKRSDEVWKLLAVIRKEFIRFADMLSKTKVKLDQASRVIGDAENKTKTIEKRLKNIEIDQDTDTPLNPIMNDDILPKIIDS